ncbi:DeoR/GlpR transcriptional regulator [Olivibacter sp. SDN3]|uniref:DeoR/GlpR family DNA-binding transcription regulator n=1 Tax=Olivibacter sp. SDN3 TaxID=2764720 RepID=UPI0016513558|nr:DeoR/GlpR family DNA-binding transcription regulator [Olivibacter sp. SDN3]QNL48504.1 DeoR/GlpR transcriptional regulator [Olivibacter sp. SDN3]
MLKEERQAFIIHEVNLHNKVLSSDLSVQLNVSEDTIRRDLNELAESGKVLKVYGGALSKSFQYPFQDNEVYARESKKSIAQKAITLIQDGMAVLLGGGTTMLELARMVPEKMQCTFFTISPLVALELAERSEDDVILIGGKLARSTNVTIGSQVINQLSEIRVDLCLLGTNSLSVEDGVTDSDWEVVQIKKAMLRCSQKTGILSIAEKLNSVQKMKVCNVNAIDYLVTDLDPLHDSLARFSQVVKII